MKGLFLNWLNGEKEDGKSQIEAINNLNEACGTKYTDSWPSKMELRGYSMERTPTPVRKYMMERVLKKLLPGHGEEHYKELTEKLT